MATTPPAERLADARLDAIRRAADLSLDAMRDNLNAAAFTRALARGNVNAALAALDFDTLGQDLAPLRTRVEALFLESAAETYRTITNG